ncbi:RNA polymerase sigma factor [Burkholderia sp. Ac-20353]|uniref:RNA polymerase sigma factor n=1 Tax=Burkholderia sp. Ac-20353 TaxID=2703894 RepID=UPI00197BA04C|nr:RNA polymerase sigma factor [Burkholderia sp. Ac-20353]MBN3792232.1 RNA polymerase sigma factor [Burkholderia sp. Ac-20353]
MSANSTLTELKERLVERYAALRRRLEHITGSRDDASEVLHETWMRLENMTEMGRVANPDGFLIRMASNVAIDRFRRERRHFHDVVDDDTPEVPDELADPERIVASRNQLAALEEVLRSLTPRQRAIVWASRVDGQVNREIAERFNISLRLVEKELSLALKLCTQRMWERSHGDQPMQNRNVESDGRE